MFNLEDVILRKGSLDIVDVDGEIVMMDLEKGKYYGFNSIGSRIWNIIEEPKTITSIIDILISEYDVSMESCREMVIKFLNGLNKEELITIM